MPLFGGTWEKVADLFSGKEAGSLTKEDLSKYVWVAFQKALAHGTLPNWWEVRVCPADEQALGGADALALACLRQVSQEWAEEGRAEQLEMQDVVLCRSDEDVPRGRAKVVAEELEERELVRRTIAAQAAGLSVVTGLVPQREVAFAITCPWNDTRVPVSHDLSIGRGATNDVVVDGFAYVSHVHGQLVRDDASESGWSYIDLGSTNGSAVNGTAVRGKTPLHPGDRIGLGSSCYVVFEEI